MNDFVIITAGGSGTRFKSDVPKQFIPIKGKPILMHTLQRFYNYDCSFNFILTLPEEHVELWRQKCDQYNFEIIHQIVKGGITRFHSVKNAIQSISNTELVCIHDGVRPLVSQETIRNSFNTARKKGNAIASQDIIFSVRNVSNSGSIAVNRNDYKEIQTPQVFRFDMLKDAYDSEYSDEFTDDATIVEKTGVKINLVRGNRENIKITTEHDLKIAEALWDTVF